MKILLISGIILLGFFFVSNVFAESYFELSQDETRATNWYFSIKPLDTWIYEQYSKSSMANWMGFGPSNAINLWPIELDGIMDNKTSLTAEFIQDETFTLKNAPLSKYEKILIKDYEDFGISTIQNTTIDGEKAVKLRGVVVDKPDLQTTQFVGWKIIIYATLHENSAYMFSLFGDPKSFDKFLPEFEQMVKSIKWIE